MGLEAKAANEIHGRGSWHCVSDPIAKMPLPPLRLCGTLLARLHQMQHQPKPAARLSSTQHPFWGLSPALTTRYSRPSSVSAPPGVSKAPGGTGGLSTSKGTSTVSTM